MIEMVYSGKNPEGNEEVRIPKNIRQIGNNQSNKKIYIEDYVMTQLKKKPEKEENIRYGVLLGETKKNSGNIYIFVKGMVEVKDIIENSLIFNDEIWSAIYKDIKQFFDQLNIVGWFVSVPYQVGNDMNGIKKLHLDNFAGNDKVCFLSDRTEKEDGFYVYEKGNLERQQGYYIYYEKNEKMKKYVKNSSNNVNQNKANQNNSAKGVEKQDIKKQETDTKTDKNSGIKQNNNNAANTDKKMQEPKSLRDIIKESRNGTKSQGRVAYGISGLLIVALLLSTVVMLNNYGELKNIKETLVGFNTDREAQVVNQLINTDVTEKASENTSVQEKSTVESESLEETKNPNETIAESESNKNIEKSANSNVSNHHTVLAGQTLYDISMKYYGTSKMVDAIKEANNIDDDYTIVEGQELILP